MKEQWDKGILNQARAQPITRALSSRHNHHWEISWLQAIIKGAPSLIKEAPSPTSSRAHPRNRHGSKAIIKQPSTRQPSWAPPIKCKGFQSHHHPSKGPSSMWPIFNAISIKGPHHLSLRLHQSYLS